MRASGKPNIGAATSSLASFRLTLSIAICTTVLIAASRSVARVERIPTASATPLAHLSESISVHASGRGNPSINLSDGREVLTSYSGPAEFTQALQRNEAEPLALASSDFDEDGVPDLVCGYGHSGSGIITWLRGNVDSIYQNSLEAQQRKAAGEFTDAPFLSPARVFGLPIEPEFLGAGDFDADGHWDIVAASRISDELYLLSGDGNGGFKEPRRIALDGAVTALVVGEINRRDGLDDVIVAISGNDGPKTLVFEGPDGALRATPETFDLPAKASALALGQMDDDYPIDLAVAAGRELLVIHGRDRKLSLNETSRNRVAPANITRRKLDFNIRSMAVGDFSGDQKTEIALLSDYGAVRLLSSTPEDARATNRPQSQELTTKLLPTATSIIRVRASASSSDDLLLVDSGSRQLHIVSAHTKPESTGALKRIGADGLQRETVSLDVEGEPIAVLPMRLNADALSGVVILKRGPSATVIVQSEPVATIIVNSAQDNNVRDDVLTLREAILLANGDLSKSSLTPAEQSQFVGNSTPGSQQLDAIHFNIPGPGVHTIAPASSLPTITDPVIIDGTTQPGFASAPVIELDGTNVLPDGSAGLQIRTGTNTVRGLAINRFPHDGIVMEQGVLNTVIEGNFIGTDATGTQALGNGSTGIGGSGVVVAGAENTGARENIIGGTSPSARNIISGNGADGVLIGGPENRVQGNFIGTNVNGLVDIGNSRAGFVGPSSFNNLIGGTTPGTRNIISGNGLTGVFLDTAKGNLVEGNFIGTDVSGSSRVFNQAYGVLLTGPNIDNTIGGTVIGARNVISGNTQMGVVLSQNGAISGTIGGNQIQNNYIGTDVTCTVAVGNAHEGILVSGAGSTLIKDNIISCNGGHGVSLGSFFLDEINQNKTFGGQGSLLEGNFIGTDGSGIRQMGNGRDGVLIDNQSFTHTVINNVIAFNGRNGVSIPNDASSSEIPAIPGSENKISQNSMYSNAALGIDLAEPSVTANDDGDGDMGANTVQNFPVLTSSATDSSSTTVEGIINSTPNQEFTIEFYSNPGDTSGFQASAAGSCVPQGRNFIGNITVRTDATGNARIHFISPTAVAGGFINATATNLTNNTSELSACVQPKFLNADISVEQTAVTSVAPGSSLRYQVTVVNNGPDLATNVVLVSRVPDNATFDSFTAPGGWTSRVPDRGGTGVLTASVAGLFPGTSATFTIVLNVNSKAEDGSIIARSATVSSDIADLTPGNNTGTSNTVVRAATPTIPPDAAADMSISLSGPAEPVFQGDAITFVLTVTNNGPAAAKELLIRLAAPNNTTFASSTKPSGWSSDCSAADGTSDIKFCAASLAPQASASFTITLTVNSDTEAKTRIEATATVTSKSDPNSDNNSANVTVTTEGRPNGPSIISIEVGDAINARGAGFSKKLAVFIDSVGFKEVTKVKGSTRIIQKGRLTDGRSIAEAVPPGKVVKMKFRNSNGGETEVSFRR